MRPYKEILRFLIIREQLSLGWKVAFFAICAALVYGSLTIRQLKVHSSEVKGTVLEDRTGMQKSASVDYFNVRLESGETVKVITKRKTGYQPGRRVVLEERASNFFGIRRHEFKRYANE